MCGIAGTFDLGSRRSASQQVLTAMADQLVHRGPDDSGYCIKNEAGFAFRRLSIIDLAHGNQPFYDETGSVVSVCNGEIFNYRELRRELQAKGHRFRTECDVEVLIPLYKEYGNDFVNKLNGQFAFAIFDDTKKQLLLVRDHVGICPLFYTVAGDTLVFGSEVKAVLKHPDVTRKVNLRGLDQILSFPGMVSPTTMFEGIHALRPGHQLVVRNGRLEEKEYWDLDYPLRAPQGRSEQDYVDEFDALLRSAVKDRLNADVPVGYYLSGGLDSSLIGSVAQQVLPDPARPSFSIAFADRDHDERPYQRMYGGHVPSVHHEIAFDWQHVADDLQRAVYYSESPLKESYNTCSLALSAAVRASGVKVILTGEGADELFAGYVGYRFDSVRSGGAISTDPDEAFEAEERQKLWGNRDFFYEKDYYALRSLKADLYAPDAVPHMAKFDVASGPLVNKARLRGRHVIHQRSYVDFKLRLSDHLLADHGDRVAYANSIEARYPFLDIRIVDFARRLPPALKLNDLVEKYIVRQVAHRYLPGGIAGREKFHFVAPGSPALLSQNIEWIKDLLSFEKIKRQGYFNPHTVERLKQLYVKPGFKLNLPFDSDLLMIVLTFGIFLEVFGMPDL